MKKLVIVLVVVIAGAGLAWNTIRGEIVEESTVSSDKAPDGGRILDLGEPTPQERSQMDRELAHRRVEEGGYSDAWDDTMQEMAGDDSAGRWEFDLE